jgi:large subunit ribosomal protein L13
MCAMIGHVLQGKNSPHYKPYQVDYNDVVVIVNAKFTWLTGKKLEQKLYRHHTGFPGGLKEIKARHYLEKNATEMVMRSIKGMLPKNKLRIDMLKKVKIYEEGGHDLYKLGLPQFGKMKAIDYNEIFGVTQIDKDSVIIRSTLDDQNLPDNLKDLKRLDKENVKMNETPKTRVNELMKLKWDRYMRTYRFRQYRNIRNKAYRYI